MRENLNLRLNFMSALNTSPLPNFFSFLLFLFFFFFSLPLLVCGYPTKLGIVDW